MSKPVLAEELLRFALVGATAVFCRSMDGAAWWGPYESGKEPEHVKRLREQHVKAAVQIAREAAAAIALTNPTNCMCSLCGDEHYDSGEAEDAAPAREQAAE